MDSSRTIISAPPDPTPPIPIYYMNEHHPPPNPPPTSIHSPPKDRIDSILETARDRRLAMSSPQTNGRQLAGAERAGETESSADEETGIVRHSSRQSLNYQSLNYQSVQSAPRPTVKVRPSTASIRRSGQIHQPSEDHDIDQTHEDKHQSWWAKLISEYGSIELENKGSVARDHLALGKESQFLHMKSILVLSADT